MNENTVSNNLERINTSVQNIRTVLEDDKIIIDDLSSEIENRFSILNHEVEQKDLEISSLNDNIIELERENEELKANQGGGSETLGGIMIFDTVEDMYNAIGGQ